MHSLDVQTLDGLSDADRWLTYQQLRHAAEFKTGGVAVHWRGLSETEVEDLRSRVLLGWRPIAERNGLDLLEFDGGVEIRARYANKGDAVRMVLDEISPDSPVAYLGDDALTPIGSEALFSEQIIRLPRIPLTYAPPAGMPEPAPSPAAARGYVTFGCFSRTARINDRVLDAWADILRRVPTARLTLNAKPFQEKSMRKAFRAHFAERGVKAGRLDLVYTTPQPTTWAAYGDIDIALDPFPHNAGTTTFEALWLGVPVVSLADRAPVGRFGKSILGAAGLGDWATDDVKAYVDKAVKAARDIPTLARLRAGLRDRIEQSPLRDPTGLARVLENAYRDLYLARADRR